MAPKKCTLVIGRSVYVRRLMNHGTVEMSITAEKDGKSYPAYYWVTTQMWKALEKDYSVRSQ